MKRCVRMQQKFFAIDICKISNEFEPSRKETIIVEDFFVNQQEFFLMSC